MTNKKEIPSYLYEKASSTLDNIELENDREEKIYRIALALEEISNDAYEQGEWDGHNKE